MFHICFQFSHTLHHFFAPKTVLSFSIFTNFKFKAHVRFNSTVHSHDFLPLAATSQGVITFSGLIFFGRVLGFTACKMMRLYRENSLSLKADPRWL